MVSWIVTVYEARKSLCSPLPTCNHLSQSHLSASQTGFLPPHLYVPSHLSNPNDFWCPILRFFLFPRVCEGVLREDLFSCLSPSSSLFCLNGRTQSKWKEIARPTLPLNFRLFRPRGASFKPPPTVICLPRTFSMAGHRSLNPPFFGRGSGVSMFFWSSRSELLPWRNLRGRELTLSN